MSIVKEEVIESDVVSETKIRLLIDNGDRQALKQVIEKYQFKDEEAVLRFAFFVLLTADDNVVSVEQSGKKINLVPSEKLLKQEHETQD